jgi:hypothetical protein
VQARKKLKKVAGWVVDRFHNRIEWDGGYTYTQTSTSPSKDQYSNGLHVTKANNVEKVGQPNMHTDLETLWLKQLQDTTTDCNMAYVVKV